MCPVSISKFKGFETYLYIRSDALRFESQYHFDWMIYVTWLNYLPILHHSFEVYTDLNTSDIVYTVPVSLSETIDSHHY